MSITSVFSLVGLLAALGLGTVAYPPTVGGSPDRSAELTSSFADGAAGARRSDVVGTKAVRRPLDTVGGTPAH
jgi:hypothetical protein